MKDHKHRQVFVAGVLRHSDDTQHRSILRGIARRAMLDRGLLPGFPPQAPGELDRIKDRGNDSMLSLSAHPTNVHGVRLLQPPVEGGLVSGFQGLAVGHSLCVQLTVAAPSATTTWRERPRYEREKRDECIHPTLPHMNGSLVKKILDKAPDK